MSVTIPIAARPEGIALVNFGKKYIIAIVKRINPHIIIAGIQVIHSPQTLN
jgi:hypothetical protein|tara:strand:- start:86 stop:238 length:153 start_codon:yes stop_codon:yes gene_type:complete